MDKVISSLIGVCSLALLAHALQRAYPQQARVVIVRLEQMSAELEQVQRFAAWPTWLQEMAQVRGEAPGPEVDPL